MQHKILFVKFRSFSNANEAVQRILETQFPDFEVDTIDAWKILTQYTPKYRFVINIYYFLKEYGLQILIGKKKWNKSHDWFLATSYISQYLSKKIQKLGKNKNYSFSIQTQSLFNGKLKNTPNFIYTDHTTRTNLLYPHINPKQYMRSNAFIEKTEKRIYEDATLIFTFGTLVKHSLITHYNIPEEKVVTIFTGSNVESNDESKSIKSFSKRILFVGVDWERKGGPTLLKAFEKVLAKHPDATLTIVGCCPKNINLPNCIVAGKMPVEKVNEYYKCADIFCLPTLREPFGMVFIEAMSYKLPIVANNIGCIPDLVINDFNGYLIDNNVNNYSEAMCKLLDNPAKCRAMGENGYKLAQTNFTWENVGCRLRKNILNALSILDYQKMKNEN